MLMGVKPHRLDTKSIFRVYTLMVDSIDQSGIELGYVRARDVSTGYLYDVQVKNRDILPTIDKILNSPDREASSDVGSFQVILGAETIDGAMVRLDPTTKTYPPIGTQNNETITCEILPMGISVPPKLVGRTTIMNNPKSGQDVPLVWNLNLHSQANGYDPMDKDARRKWQVLGAGITSGPGGLSMGTGVNQMNISPKGGMNLDVENQTHSTQESDHGGGMFTTSFNFLQHYFIHLAGAVSLPMNHMVNLVKMLAMGKFVKDIIGSKKSKTGIFGLAEEISTTAKS